MSDNPEGAQREMEKAIFISADCWLEVFDLLPRSQLGLGIALISRRFDCFVDEHFKTRKWTLENIQIYWKIGENGAKEMKIYTYAKALPNPQNPLPNKVIGFRSISINFFDQNVLTFIRRFDRFFASCSTMLDIFTENVRISEFAMFTIWPMFKDTIHVMCLNPIAFRQMRQLAPSMLNDCPFLYKVSFHCDIFPEFPPDDSANASDGQAVTKWLFTPRPDNLPKRLTMRIDYSAGDQVLATVEQIKAAFSIASSSVHFCIVIQFQSFSAPSSVVPFELTNELTGEKLALLPMHKNILLLIRCPISMLKRCPNAFSYEQYWSKEIKKMYYQRKDNEIEFFIRDERVDDGLLNAASSAGPSGDH